LDSVARHRPMCPCSCSACTIFSLCSGETRANTRTLSTLAFQLGRRTTGRALPRSAPDRPPGMPSWRAISAAVSGWSPVIITVRTPAGIRQLDRIFYLGARRVNHPGTGRRKSAPAPDRFGESVAAPPAGGRLSQHAASPAARALIGLLHPRLPSAYPGFQATVIPDMGRDIQQAATLPLREMRSAVWASISWPMSVVGCLLNLMNGGHAFGGRSRRQLRGRG